MDKLAYELLNEAVAEDPDDWNKLIAKGIEVVRANEPDRVIVVGSNQWQQGHTFKDLITVRLVSNWNLNDLFFESESPHSLIFQWVYQENHFLSIF